MACSLSAHQSARNDKRISFVFENDEIGSANDCPPENLHAELNFESKQIGTGTPEDEGVDTGDRRSNSGATDDPALTTYPSVSLPSIPLKGARDSSLDSLNTVKYGRRLNLSLHPFATATTAAAAASTLSSQQSSDSNSVTPVASLLPPPPPLLLYSPLPPPPPSQFRSVPFAAHIVQPASFLEACPMMRPSSVASSAVVPPLLREEHSSDDVGYSFDPTATAALRRLIAQLLAAFPQFIFPESVVKHIAGRCDPHVADLTSANALALTSKAKEKTKLPKAAKSCALSAFGKSSAILIAKSCASEAPDGIAAALAVDHHSPKDPDEALATAQPSANATVVANKKKSKAATSTHSATLTAKGPTAVHSSHATAANVRWPLWQSSDCHLGGTITSPTFESSAGFVSTFLGDARAAAAEAAADQHASREVSTPTMDEIVLSSIVDAFSSADADGECPLPAVAVGYNASGFLLCLSSQRIRWTFNDIVVSSLREKNDKKKSSSASTALPMLSDIWRGMQSSAMARNKNMKRILRDDDDEFTMATNGKRHRAEHSEPGVVAERGKKRKMLQSSAGVADGLRRPLLVAPPPSPRSTACGEQCCVAGVFSVPSSFVCLPWLRAVSDSQIPISADQLLPQRATEGGLSLNCPHEAAAASAVVVELAEHFGPSAVPLAAVVGPSLDTEPPQPPEPLCWSERRASDGDDAADDDDDASDLSSACETDTNSDSDSYDAGSSPEEAPALEEGEDASNTMPHTTVSSGTVCPFDTMSKAFGSQCICLRCCLASAMRAVVTCGDSTGASPPSSTVHIGPRDEQRVLSAVLIALLCAAEQTAAAAA